MSPLSIIALEQYNRRYTELTFREQQIVRLLIREAELEENKNKNGKKG